MQPKITKVHRGGVTYYATTVSGVYIERRTLKELQTDLPATWPFPPPGGPIPLTPAEERQYQRQRRDQLPPAPF